MGAFASRQRLINPSQTFLALEKVETAEANINAYAPEISSYHIEIRTFNLFTPFYLSSH